MAIFQQGLFTYDPKTDTPETIARKRAIVNQILGTSRAPKTIGEGLSALGDGIVANVLNRRANAGESAGKASANDMFSRITSAISGGGSIEPATSFVGGVPVGNVERAPLDPISDRVAQANGDDSGFDPRIRTGIVETANALGIDPVDLATTISYETAGTFDPTKRGPKTQWGQHKGFIQFGEPQAQQHGVDWSRPIESQLGADGAVASYLRKAGVQPGMGLLDVYSAVNAGAPGLYNRSDANNGGAPGTVRDKVEQQMAGHRAKAMALLGVGNETPTASEAIMTAYAPQPQAGALAAAPFPSAGLPTDTGKSDRLALPENQLTMDYAPTQGGDYVDPVMSPNSTGYAPQPAGGLTGQVAPNDPGMWGAGMDPSNPATIPAMAGGTRDILPAGSPGQFPAAPMQQQAPQQAMQGQGAQGGGFMNLPPQLLLDAISNPFMDEGTKAFASSVLEMQMQAQDPYRRMQLEKGQLELEQMRNPQPGYRVLSPEEAQSLGLAPDKTYQVGPDGKVGQVGGSMVEVNVNNDTAPGLGKLSSDYGYVMDPETRQPVIDPNTGLPQAAPVPGSPAARAIQEEEAAKAAGKRNASDYARTVTQDVGIADSYLSEIDGIYASDGIVGANLRAQRAGIRGTPEYNMKTFMDSALSNVTLDTMNRMRETSAAGATGMGNMSDKQLKVIQGVLGQWDPALPVADQRMILHRLGNFYLDVQFGTKQERAEAVRDGRMTQEESAAIEQMYYPETRDLKGRRVDGSGDAPAGWEEEWEYLTPEERQQIMQSR